jgi:hypothetical protein
VPAVVRLAFAHVVDAIRRSERYCEIIGGGTGHTGIAALVGADMGMILQKQRQTFL